VEARGPIVLNFGQEENKNNTIIHGRAVSGSSNQTDMHSQIAISMLDCPLQRSKNIRREQSGKRSELFQQATLVTPQWGKESGLPQDFSANAAESGGIRIASALPEGMRRTH
jgi:hypothetical protein